MSNNATYDLTAAIEAYTRRLVAAMPVFSHINVDRVLFGIAKSRKRTRYGTHAACYPLRFENGRRTLRHGRTLWEWPDITHRGERVLYYIAFYVPRFLNLETAKKVETIVHELYHVSPRFNGDVRRLGTGNKAYHGPSLEYFDKLIAPFVQEARSLKLQHEYHFLKYSFAELQKRYGKIVGQRPLRLRPQRASPVRRKKKKSTG